MKLTNQLLSILVASSLSSTLTAAEKVKEPPRKSQKCTVATQAAIDKLILKLGNKESKIRTEAIMTLTKIGNPAMKALNKATKNKDPEISQNAKNVIVLITLANNKALKQGKSIDNCPACGRG